MMYGNNKKKKNNNTVLRNLDSNVSRGQLEEFITVVTAKVVRLNFRRKVRIHTRRTGAGYA